MKNKGIIFGWIMGMILQLIIAPRFSDDFINKSWWIVQLCGFGVVTILAIVLDKKLMKNIKSWFKSVDWSNIGENLIELSKYIWNSIDKNLCELWDFINNKSHKILNNINKWLKS